VKSPMKGGPFGIKVIKKTDKGSVCRKGASKEGL